MKDQNQTMKFSLLKNLQSYLLIFVIVLLGDSCRQKELRPEAAFYHWKTELQISSAEAKTMNRLGVNKLYIKFFDLDINEKNEAVPLAVLQCKEKLSDSIQIIPTVFITNRTLKRTSEDALDQLAQKLLQKIRTTWPAVSKHLMEEIQFDCDWTPTTQQKYFQLLRSFKSHLTKANKSCQLSATIRLHQIKYAADTGIPPVDRGMLMFYNMGDLEDWNTDNSILDIQIAKQYLNASTNYKLPLDIALPVFRWGVLFRNDKMIKLINNLSSSELEDRSRFEKAAKNRYEVIKSTYLKGYYLYEKDAIRLESVKEKELIEAAQFLDGLLPNMVVGSRQTNPRITVSFYHLDTATLNHYSDETLEHVLYEFSK